jgi:hypothetical protein
MTDSIRGTGACPAGPATTDDYLRAATGARADASAAHHAEGHDPAAEYGHVAVDATGAALDVVGASMEGAAIGFGLEVTGALTAIAAQWAGYALAVEEGHRRGVDYDSEMMRGCLTAFEGRADEPSVREYVAASPAFANGVRDAERIAVRDPELFACIRAAVVAAGSAGAQAVYEGTDGSPEVRERCATDLAFRHGVERARQLREHDPAAYEAARAEALALGSSLEAGRAMATVRA